MKTKLLGISVLFVLTWAVFAGFSPQDESPRWSMHPSTRINIEPVGTYQALPENYDWMDENVPRDVITPQGTFSVGANVAVFPTGTVTQSEVPITRHPTNPYIIFASANTYPVGTATTISTGSFVSTNGGVTWTGNNAPINNFGDPAPMVDKDGRFLISYITSTGSMGASYSTDNGSTFSGTVTFPGASTAADKNLSCTDDDPTSPFYGRSYTVYTEFGGSFVNRIVGTYTTNGGVNWSSISVISPPTSSGHHHQGCDVRTGPGGIVYVVWANCITNGQNSTEDSLGFAYSTNGGVSWLGARNNAINLNGIRTSDLFNLTANTVRCNGFPRIDVDRTCGPFAGYIYVVLSEKRFAPALGRADVILCRSTNQGTSWTRVKVNQNTDTSEMEYLPAVRVDESGGVNVSYYSTRNSADDSQAQYFMSRSTDGGATWVDVQISTTLFTPNGISGLAAGYQGDYTGITSGGNGKLFPYWCDNRTGVYKAYTALVDISKSTICEDFTCTNNFGSFEGLNTYVEYTGTRYWTRQNPSAYAIGTGSAKFDFWNASAGVSQSLTTYSFTAVGSGQWICFDRAYSPWTVGIDSLIVETSANEGLTYTALAKLWGGFNAVGGDNSLNTVGVIGNFTPTSVSQWAPMAFPLPVGTNKLRLRARSGFGNNLYIDNLCIRGSAINNSIGVVPEAMWVYGYPFILYHDTVRVYKLRADFPSVVADSSKATILDNVVVNDLRFNIITNGNYYTKVVHRNTITIWSSSGLAYTRGSNSHFNFLSPAGQAYANNQKVLQPIIPYYGMYSGEVERDGTIDGSDLLRMENAANSFSTGYIPEDLDGNGFLDGGDLAIAFNNAAAFVSEIPPPGAGPAPENMHNVEPGMKFDNDAVQRKYEEGLKFVTDLKKNTPEVKKKSISYQEFLEMKRAEFAKLEKEIAESNKRNSGK